MKYPHIFSRKSMARLEDEIKLKRKIKDPIDRFDVWKASHWRNGREYKWGGLKLSFQDKLSNIRDKGELIENGQ